MKIRELYTDSSKWTQKVGARDKNGEEECSTSSDAVCWCLSGATNICYPDNEQFNNVRKKIREKIGVDSGFAIADWNDAPERTFEEVKALVEELDI